jgi:hypothetical protein
MSGSTQFTPGFEGTLTLELTVETTPGEQAEGVDHSQPTPALTVEHADVRSPIEMQVASEDHQAFQVLIRAEVAMDATGGLKRRPGEGRGRTWLRSVLMLAQRVPAGVLVVPLALLLFLLTISNDAITALTVVPLWVVLPPLVLLLLLLVFAQRGRLTVRTAVPVWTLLVPGTLLLLLLGLARASMPTAGGHPSGHSPAAVRSNPAFATVTNRRLPKPPHAVAFTLAHARATTPSRKHPVCDPGQPC